MSERFSKRKAYDEIIAALKELSKENHNTVTLENFKGFGALKELLLPIDDTSGWGKTDLEYLEKVKQFHDALRKAFPDKYDEALTGIKNSILSSFYTPESVIVAKVAALAGEFQAKEILDPSSGTGAYVSALKQLYPEANITAIEKDLVTSNLLSAIHPDIETHNKGFEEFRNRKFDLVISNIPFGNVNVYDDQIYREANPVKVKSTTRIHNFFFVKGVDNLKEGGILAYITSAGVMDSSSNEEIRNHLMKNADLVSAIRLPNDVFEQAGTFPMTDIVLLRKNSTKKGLSADEKLFVKSGKIVLEDDGRSVSFDVNSYYQKHPERVLGKFVSGGQYGRESLDCEPSGEIKAILEARIHELVKQDLKAALEYEITPEVVIDSPDLAFSLFKEVPDRFKDKQLLREGNLVAVNGEAGIVVIAPSGKVYVKPSPGIGKFYDRVANIVELRNLTNALVESELASDKDKMAVLRQQLNESYDSFVFRYGNFHDGHNKRLLSIDIEGFKLTALERLENGVVVKADIFSKQVNNVQAEYKKLSSLSDAVLSSLNATNEIDANFISDLTGKQPNVIVTEGINNDLIFVEAHDDGSIKYVAKDEFLSGNIVKKLEVISDRSTKYPSWFTEEHRAKQIALLQEARPKYLSRELIDINLGVRWVPNDIYESFAQELFGVGVNVQYLKSANQYLVKLHDYSDESAIKYAASIHGGGTISGRQLLEYAMVDVMPKLSIKVSDGPPPKYVPDVDGMKNAEGKIKEIKEKFVEYTTRNRVVSERLEGIYNRTINCFVERSFDGSHLTFDKIDDQVQAKLHKYQPNAVWKLLQNDGGIIDHVVGAGKTLTMALAANKMRQLGVARKPFVICLKANVDQVGKEFKKAFPDAKILCPTEKDFTPRNRKTVFSRIATNEWDAVIMTHDNFLKIPQSPQMFKKLLREELQNLEDDLKVIKGDSTFSKRMLKGLETRKANLSSKLKSLELSFDRDQDIMNFDTMGCDHLFVDESHEFKNLAFTTRHQSVAGLGSPEGSAKATNLLVAARTLQEKRGGDSGITFSTGTPISNSLVELYLLKKYLRPNKLAEQGINSFDAWAQMFAKKSATYEFSVTNELKIKERYREFVNVPELKMWFSEMAHVVTKAELGEDKPTLVTKLVNIDPTPEQKEYTKALINFAKTRNPAYIGLPPLTKGEETALMLLCTNLATKMSLDMRLISQTKYRFNEKGKIAELCGNVANEYVDSSHYKGTQLIFSDLGIPGGASFDVYSEIKRVLVTKYGIPANEIAFVHDYDTNKKKEDLTEKMSDGRIRITIGGTKKLGTGWNLQKRIIALHDLDIPWRPSDMDQRGGRGARQGAWAAKTYRDNKVKRYVYATNQTLDAYRFNFLSNKQKFIDQVTTSDKLTQRRIDEGGIDQDGAMNYSEWLAVLSGNNDLLEKVKLEKKLTDLQRSFDAFCMQRSEAEQNKKYVIGKIETLDKSLSKLKVDAALLNELDLEKELITLSHSAKALEDKKVIGSALQERVKDLATKAKNGISTTDLAQLGKFKLVFEINKNDVDKVSRCYVISAQGQKYNYAEGVLNENPALAGRFIIDAIKRIPKVVERTSSDIEDCQKTLAAYDSVLKEEFRGTGEIKMLEQQIQELDAKIQAEALATTKAANDTALEQTSSNVENLELDTSMDISL